MKDKRIWIVIGCILAIGTGVTHYTQYYVKSQGEAMIAETTAGAGEMTEAGDFLASVSDKRGLEAEEPGAGEGTAAVPENRRIAGASAGIGNMGAGAVPGPGAAAGPEGDAGPRADAGPGAAAGPEAAAAPAQGALSGRTEEETMAAEETALPETGADAAQMPGQETDPASELPLSPLEGAKPGEYKTSLETDYRRRLEDLDNQILKMREEETDSNVYSIKTSAETELKMWESELNSIYNALLDMMSQEDAARLVSEQQDWLKNRDARAAENSGKKGGSMDGIGYAATLAGLTRDRAYELTERYEEAGETAPRKEALSPAAP